MLSVQILSHTKYNTEQIEDGCLVNKEILVKGWKNTQLAIKQFYLNVSSRHMARALVFLLLFSSRTYSVL